MKQASSAHEWHVFIMLKDLIDFASNFLYVSGFLKKFVNLVSNSGIPASILTIS
jgi:hypothetical protein